MSKSFTTEIWPLADLVPYAKNAKKHDPAKIKALAGLIKTHGFTQPIVVYATTREIIAGHGRRMAAMEAGLTEVPVFVFHGTKEQAAALRLSDNQVVSKGFDMELLQAELAELAGADMDLGLLGFSDKELSFLTVPLEASLDESLFVEDVQGAVETQREQNEARADEVDATTAPLADAFGFRRLSVAQSRRVRAFMTRLEAETGAKGAEALMTFLDNLEEA